MLEQGAQRSCGYPIPGGFLGARLNGQSGLVLDLAVSNPACGRVLELHNLCGLFQPKPFYDINANDILL